MYTYKFNLNTICELNAIILKNESSEEAKSGTSRSSGKQKLLKSNVDLFSET